MLFVDIYCLLLNFRNYRTDMNDNHSVEMLKGKVNTEQAVVDVVYAHGNKDDG